MNGFITFLGTNNLEKTRKFYKSTLDLSIYKDQGTCLIFSITESGKLGFCKHIEKTVKEKSPIITLLVDDVDNHYKRLVNKGVKDISEPKKNKKFNIYHFFLKDPNGYTIEIQKFL